MFKNLAGAAKRALSKLGQPDVVSKSLAGAAGRFIGQRSPKSAQPTYAQRLSSTREEFKPQQQTTGQQWTPPEASPPLRSTVPTYAQQKTGGGIGTYQPPPMQQTGVRSQEEAAQRLLDRQMNKYSELVQPRHEELSSYLASRRPYGEVYQEQLGQQGATQKGQMLSDFERQIIEQQELLRTVPQEDVERRRETGGTITEAAARRIKAKEQEPFFERLQTISPLYQQAQVGYDRALQLAQQFTQGYGQETEAGVRQRQVALDAAREQYGQFADGISQQLTGWTADNEAALSQYEAAVQQGYQLDQIQAQQAAQLKQQESSYVTTMKLASNVEADAKRGVLLKDVMARYTTQGIEPDMILTIYNAASIYGPAQEKPEQLASLFGVSPRRYMEGAGGSGAIDQLVGQGT